MYTEILQQHFTKYYIEHRDMVEEVSLGRRESDESVLHKIRVAGKKSACFWVNWPIFDRSLS